MLELEKSMEGRLRDIEGEGKALEIDSKYVQGFVGIILIFIYIGLFYFYNNLMKLV